MFEFIFQIIKSTYTFWGIFIAIFLYYAFLYTFKKIKKKDKKDYIILWLPIILFLYFSIYSIIQRDKIISCIPDNLLSDKAKEVMHKNFQIVSLLILNYFLIMYAAITYAFIDIWHIIGLAVKNSSSENIRIKLLYTSFCCTFFSGCLVIIFFIFAVYHLFRSPEIDWNILLKTNEFFSLGIFFLFILVDFFIVKSIRNESIIRDFADAKYVANKSLYIVDFPCCIGILFIIFYQCCIHHISELSFSNGVSIGAIAIHVVITQSNYAYIKTEILTRK